MALGCAAGEEPTSSSTGTGTGDGGGFTGGGGDNTSSVGGGTLTGAGGGNVMEICGDVIDNDMDGQIDEDCSCEVGTIEECYNGPIAAKGVGACVVGTRLCTSKGEFGEWGPCEGEIHPGTETCDAALTDENCDGTINEDCACVDGGPPTVCGTDEGACQAGTQTCLNGVLGTCMGQLGPFVESCNNVDDDCDTMIDDGLSTPCGTDVGECTAGASVCTAGAWGSCTGGNGPAAETCNDLDDDCDGQTDEMITQPCGTDVGDCTTGLQTCTAGSFGTCVGGVMAGIEDCNGGDEDCDGLTDEGCGCTNGNVQPCGTDVGECVAGTQTCSGGMWGTCMGSIGPTNELCDNEDDDCDGSTDEGITQTCGTDVGECTAGVQTCTAGAFGSCVGSVGPGTETCNNLDDDCDGLKDETLTQQCGTTDVGACQYGLQTCSNGAYGSCQGSIGPVTEICVNNIDDDCDGVSDANDCPMSPPTCTCPSTPTNTVPLSNVPLSATCTDPDGGTVTYQWAVTTAPTGSTTTPASPTSASTSLFLDLAGSYTVTMTATDDENQTFVCTKVINANAPTNTLHVELVWDEAYGDADLHLTRPGVPLASAWYDAKIMGFGNDNDCYWRTCANGSPMWAGADPSLDADDQNGYGPETINIGVTPGNGTYAIGVDYFCQNSAAGSGPTTATVKVFCGSNLIATYNNINLDETGRFVHVANLTWNNGTCTSASVMMNTWTALVQQSYWGVVPQHCSVACSGNGDCTPGESCGSGGYCIVN